MTSDHDQRLAGLMRRAQDGDRRAYESLLTEVLTIVRHFVRRRLRQPDWEEEIVQETLLCIHRDRHTYDPDRPFGPWMYAIAWHRLVDHVERQRRRSATEISSDAELDAAVPPPRPWGFLHQALAQLSARQRDIIRMLKFEGFSVAEIAQQTGLSQPTVKVTAHRGYKKLRQLLGEPE